MYVLLLFGSFTTIYLLENQRIIEIQKNYHVYTHTHSLCLWYCSIVYLCVIIIASGFVMQLTSGAVL